MEIDINNKVPVLKAVRKKCLDCMRGSSNEVKLCPSHDCPLYAFRFGKNPYRTKREMSEEQRQAVAERFRKAREAKE